MQPFRNADAPLGGRRRGPRRSLPLLDLLELQPAGIDRYLAVAPGEGPGRLYGGQVASQALRAATLTVEPDRSPHSLHCYFIRPGRPGVTLQLDVERTRDGRSFSTRHVTASQAGEPIFILIASFHLAETGTDWQDGGLPDVPAPQELAATNSSGWEHWGAGFEMLPVNGRAGGFMGLHPCWVRLREPIGDDTLLHACALTFISDRAVVGSARAPSSQLRVSTASLDHSVWFHRPVRVDEWLLFSVDPVTNFGARGLARGTFHTESGVLVASIAQEALLRPV